MSIELAVVAIVLVALALVGFGPAVAERIRRRPSDSGRSTPVPQGSYDPGRERRAERKARELLRAAVGEQEYAMFEALGFLHVPGHGSDGRPAGYAYLVYPHRPIVAYDTESDELLSEYCVGFPDRAEQAFGSRLPGADDVLAKWMSLHGDERGLIAGANMHLPGRQVDPGQVRRDLRRLRAWQARQTPPQPRTGVEAA